MKAVAFVPLLLASIIIAGSVAHPRLVNPGLAIVATAGHSPIYINGDANFTPANGVVGGTGSASDPFLILGWNISAVSQNGIEIDNTTAHFLVSHVEVHSGSSYHDGIALYNVKNGRIENSRLEDNRYGVYYLGFPPLLSGWAAIAASDSSFTTNDITSNRIGGIFVSSVANLSFTFNTISGNGGTGLDLDKTFNVLVSSNNVTGNAGDGISRNFSGTIASAGTAGPSPDGLYGIGVGNNTTVVFNVVSSNAWNGISVGGEVTNVTIKGNAVLGNGRGISVDLADQVTVASNHIEANRGVGMSLLSVQNATVAFNNVAWNLGAGLDITGFAILRLTGNSTVHDNMLEGNAQGMSISNDSRIRVYHNDFDVNTGSTSDSGSNDTWDTGYPSGGNFWSDYGGPDRCSGPLQDNCTGSDGIGDIPYPIAPNGRDRYPLMQPVLVPPPLTPLRSLVLSSLTITPSRIDFTQTSFFSVTALGDRDGYRYSWSGLPPGCASQDLPSLACTPSTNGSYEIGVSVTDSAGAQANAGPTELTVLKPTWLDVGASPRRGIAPLTVLFTVVVPSGIPPPRWTWFFGDGTKATAANPTHVYGEAGSYTALGCPADPLGANNCVVFSIAVLAPLSVHVTAYPSSLTLGNATTIIVTALGGWPGYAYAWSSVPSGCSAGNVSAFVCAPSEVGTYAVHVTVTDSDGNSRAAAVAIQVTAPGPADHTLAVILVGIGVGVPTAIALALIYRRSLRPAPGPRLSKKGP